MFRHAVLLMSTAKVFMASSDYSHTLLLGTRCSERVTAVAQSGKTTSHTGLGVPLAKCLYETFVTRDFLLKCMN